MDVRLSSCVTLVLVTLCPAFGHAQVQAPKAAPEGQRLASYVGTWKLEGEVMAGSDGRRDKVSGTATCEWFDGNFHVVCRGEFQVGGFGKMTNLEIVSYDRKAGGYSYHAFNSLGATVSGSGSVSGDTWTWLWEDRVAGNAARLRETRAEKTATRHTFRIEYSVLDGPWTLLQEGTVTRLR